MTAQRANKAATTLQETEAVSEITLYLLYSALHLLSAQKVAIMTQKVKIHLKIMACRVLTSTNSYVTD